MSRRKQRAAIGPSCSDPSSVAIRTVVAEQAEALERQIEMAMPPSGKVRVVQITDKQYENIRPYRAENVNPRPRIRISLRCFEVVKRGFVGPPTNKKALIFRALSPYQYWRSGD